MVRKRSVPTDEMVDFEEELELFQQMVDRDTNKRIMLITARSGRGKTCLLRLLRDRCKQQGVPCAFIDFRGDPYAHPHFDLARRLYVDLGIEPRRLFEALSVSPIDLFAGETTGIAIEGCARDVFVDKVAGKNIFENSQLLVNLTVSDDRLGDRFTRELLIDAFIEDVVMVSREKTLVCLFDSVEDISQVEEEWLIEALLMPMTDNPSWSKVIAVIAGKQILDLEKYWDWGDWGLLEDIVQNHALPEVLSIQHYRDYARKVGIVLSEERVKDFYRASRGIPIMMAALIKN